MEAAISDFIFKAFFGLFLFSGFSCLIGFINPALVLWWLTKSKQTRGRVLITYLTLTIFSLVIVASYVLPAEHRQRVSRKTLEHKKDHARINKIIQKHIRRVYGRKVTFILSDRHLAVYCRASEDITIEMLNVIESIPRQSIMLNAAAVFYNVFSDERLNFLREITVYPRMSMTHVGSNGKREEIWEDIAAVQMPRDLAGRINWSALIKRRMPIEEFEAVLKRYGYIRWLY